MRFQYADDVVEEPLPEELHVAPPPSPGLGVDGLPGDFTYDDLFDEPPLGEGGPAPAVQVLDYEQLRDRAIALNNPQMHQALPDPLVNPNPQWPAPVQLPLAELAFRASTFIDDNWLRRGQRPNDRSWRGRTEFLVEWAATQPRGRA